RREPAIESCKAIPALHASAERLRIKTGGKVVAGKGEAVGRHPVVGVGERGGEISRAPSRRAVDAGLKSGALYSADPPRQGPIGAAAGEREAHHGARREAIVEPGGAARGARRQIVAADHGHVAGRAVAAAIARPPHAPALLEARWLGRLFQYLRI